MCMGSCKQAVRLTVDDYPSNAALLVSKNLDGQVPFAGVKNYLYLETTYL